ncbi:polycystin-1-like protein 1 [Haemaphysalis longicornis]
MTRINVVNNSCGGYTVGVTCQNLVSSVASGVLTLRMVQRVVNATAIVNVGPVLVARPSQLRVVYSQGSNLTFRWHFGDGSYPATVTDGPHVWHTYHSAGEFLVNVTVFNAVSSAHFGTNVFATEYPCNKSEVSINRYTEHLSYRRR